MKFYLAADRRSTGVAVVVYVCMAMCVALINIEKPFISGKDSKNSFQEGNKTKLTCIYTSISSSISYTWRHNNKDLPNNNMKYLMQKNELVILNMSRTHDGNYSCRARINSELTRWSEVYTIHVLYKPYLEEAHQENSVTVQTGQRVELSLWVDAKPRSHVQFTWSRYDPVSDSVIPVVASDRLKFKVDDVQIRGRLIILDVDASDAGVYRVTASNVIGNLTVDRTLHVENIKATEAPTSFPVIKDVAANEETSTDAPTSFPVKEVAIAISVVLFVVVIIVIALCVYCKKNSSASTRRRNTGTGSTKHTDAGDSPEYRAINEAHDDEVTYSDIRTTTAGSSQPVKHTDDGMYALFDKNRIQKEDADASEYVNLRVTEINQTGKTPVLLGDDGIQYMDPKQLDLKEPAPDSQPPTQESTLYAELQ